MFPYLTAFRHLSSRPRGSNARLRAALTIGHRGIFAMLRHAGRTVNPHQKSHFSEQTMKFGFVSQCTAYAVWTRPIAGGKRTRSSPFWSSAVVGAFTKRSQIIVVNTTL